jgi:ubiquinone/menaquinone biosynthesis C-methylase UbiE
MAQAYTEKECSDVQPRLSDYVSLWLLKLAKIRRRTLTIPEREGYAEFYAEFFETKDIEAYEQDVRMVVRRDTVTAWLKRHGPAQAKVLDVGCGLGDILMGLPATYVLHGLDYADSNVAMLRRRLGERADIRQGTVYEIPHPSNSMDACICLEVLEHIEDDAHGVRELVRVLKPGGVLIASVPYQYYWPEYFRLMGHFRHYTRETFSQLLRNNGLITESYLPNYPNWHQTYSRRYALIRAQFIVFGRLFGCQTLYTFKWPWQRQPALTKLIERLEYLRERDMELDYAHGVTSTFIVARKPAN